MADRTPNMSHRYVPHPDDGWDEVRETIDGFTTVEASFYPGRYSENYTYPVRYEGPSQESFKQMEPSLGPAEVIDLARSAVENGRQETKRSLAGTEGVSEAVELKLTIDLGHQNIQDIPKEVVSIIKDEVARLSLSHNQIWHIPYKFAECTKLTYVNIRYNLLKEFPKAVGTPSTYRQLLHLNQLQILDLSRNKLQKIPEDIGNMTALRVLSIQHNRLENLPLCLADLSTLQILKVAGNPLVTPLKRVAEGKDGDPIPALSTDNERDTFLTSNVKKYLRQSAVPVRSEIESGGESSEGPLDTPRPLKRGLSGRFPVIPSTSGSESASDARSPALTRPPPIPSRSHYRVASGQNAVLQNAALRRPGVAPLSAGNERNRSNSESILQATQATRNKRMGIVPRKQTNLSTVDETRTNRYSHYRGLSHGSVLHEKHSNGLGGGNSSSSPVSPAENERQRPTFVKRLSSLPEHKRDSQSSDEIVEAAKGILYSLFQVHPHISTLISVARDGASKRTSLEQVYYNASTHVEELDKELHLFDTFFDEEEEGERSNDAVYRACATCIMAYEHVGSLLLQNLGNIVQNGDPRYVRTLLLLIFGSLVEARNACSSLGIALRGIEQIESQERKTDVIHEEGPQRRDPSITPTRVRPNPAKRLRSDTAIQHATHYSSYAMSGNNTPAVPLYVNGRSRSNSRTNTLTSSTVSSVANTPRSGESFGLPGTPWTNFRSNTMHGVDESESEAMFEKIFLNLTNAYDHALKGMPLVHRHVSRCLEVALETHTTREICAFWKHLVDSCLVALDVSGALKIRLANLKLKDPGLRNQRDFWQLCNAFTKALVVVLMGVKRAKELEIIPTDIIQVLRPVQTSVKEAGKLINNSPWSYLAADNPPAHDAYHHSSNSSSPYVTSIPATPLSAALGPAAQAT
ncbi:MAG: RAM signaling network component, partial [Pleopsidium flavum]